MNAIIEFIYVTVFGNTRTLRRASFPLKGRKPEQVAFDWWQQIKKETLIDRLDKAICNGEDITEIIKKMDT